MDISLRASFETKVLQKFLKSIFLMQNFIRIFEVFYLHTKYEKMHKWNRKFYVLENLITYRIRLK